MHRCGIALGSNLGDRAKNLRQARDRLFALHRGEGEPLCSGVYETDPVDCPPDSESFLNAVIEVETDLEPEPLLAECLAIETALGRPDELDRPPNAPRTIDLDLLYAGDRVISKPGHLELPHPRAHLRMFVLRPLADIRPDLVLPGQETPVSELLAELENRSEKIEKSAPRNW